MQQLAPGSARAVCRRYFYNTSRGYNLTRAGRRHLSQSIQQARKQFFQLTEGELRIQLPQAVELYQCLPRTLARQIRRFCNIPKGFKNFYPKRGGSKKSTPKEGETETRAKTESEASEAEAAKDEGGVPKKPKEPEGGKKKGPKDFKDMAMSNLWLVFVGLSLLSLVNSEKKGSENEISFQQFKIHMLEEGMVEKVVVVNKQVARVHLRKDAAFSDGDFGGSSSSSRQRFEMDKVYHFTIGSVDTFESKLETAQRDMRIRPQDWIPVSYASETSWSDWLFKSPVLYTGLFVLIVWSLSRKAGDVMSGGLGGKGGMGGPGGMNNMFSMGKANVTVINKGEKVKTRFKDVAGLQQAKEEVMEFVKFLKNPKQFTKLGAKIPKGALLVGPPGTGKTLLAKAVAGEAESPFFSISGSDFIEMFVGVGPSRVRDLFAQARANAPCIVFIDEIDAVGRKRSKGGFAGGNDERENTLNQLLVEMDGFTETSNIVILAGTNRADVLDEALTRPGRFDRKIQVDLPDIKDRIEIFDVHLENLTLGIEKADVSKRMATLTPGFSGADIANVCNEGALNAARDGKDAIEMVDFYKANDRVIGGVEKRVQMAVVERERIAYHEAGHAVVGWFLEFAEPLLKVTIVPRGGGALGFAQYLPKDLALYTQDALNDMMCMTLGGRASEEVFYGNVSTGAADDLKKVTRLAYGQVQIYGMGDIGLLSYPPEDGSYSKPFSEATGELIDKECRTIVTNAYQRTVELLKERRADVEALATRLLKDETIDHDTIVEVLGERPFQNDQYKEYMSNTEEFREKHGHENTAGPVKEIKEGDAESETKEEKENPFDLPWPEADPNADDEKPKE